MLFAFSNQVNRLNISIDNRIKLYRAMLKGGRGFIETSEDLNSEKVCNICRQSRFAELIIREFRESVIRNFFRHPQRENVVQKDEIGRLCTDFKMFPRR